MAKNTLDRRTVLKGVLATGATVSIPLPLLEIMLNGNGTAYAASGAVMCIPANACMGGDMGQCCNNNGMAGICANGTCSGTSSTCNGQPCQ